MQITPELIQGVRMAGNMTRNIMGGASKLMGSDAPQTQPAVEKTSSSAAAAASAAQEKEMRRGMRLAVYALLESGQDFESIVRLLEKYWEIPHTDAAAFAAKMQTVEYPVRSLKLYLQSQGWTTEQITSFIKARNVKETLRNDPSHELWKLSPEKLAYRLSGRV